MKNKILIIDDDIIYRKIIQKILCNKYQLLLAENSIEALAYIKSKNIPDLIIADLNMPGIAGIELITLIKQKLNNSKIPVMVISGMDDDKLKNNLFQDGISDYLTKPIDRIVLKEKVDKLINH